MISYMENLPSHTGLFKDICDNKKLTKSALGPLVVFKNINRN